MRKDHDIFKINFLFSSLIYFRSVKDTACGLNPAHGAPHHPAPCDFPGSELPHTVHARPAPCTMPGTHVTGGICFKSCTACGTHSGWSGTALHKESPLRPDALCAVWVMDQLEQASHVMWILQHVC